MKGINTNTHLFKILKLSFKVGFSLFALYYVTTKIDLQTVFHSLRHISYPLVFLAIVFLLLSIVVAAFRLNTLFKAMPLHVSHTTNFKLYWLGLFYNLFLPGGVGGDGYKIFLINKYHKKPVKSLIGVILSDRLSGLSVIFIYLLILVYSLQLTLPYVNWLGALIPFFFGGYWLFLYLFNRSLLPKYWKVLGWSLLSQLLQILVAFCILYAIGDELDFRGGEYMFLFLVSSITSSIPISLGGIGLREMTFLYGANYLGLSAEHAVSLSFIFYLLSLLVSLPGIVFTFDTSKLLEGEETLITEEEADAEIV